MNWYKISQATESPIWQQSRQDYVGPWEERYGEDDEGYKDYIHRRQGWDKAMQHALAIGDIPPEKANELGFFGTQSEKIQPLPDTLYHVTTAKTSVINDSLKTREELSQGLGKGLGGGDSNTVSFTTDINMARTIKNALFEAKKVGSGELSIEKMFDMADKGEGAKQPWLSRTINYWAEKWQPGDELPLPIKLLIQGYDLKQGMWPYTVEEMNQREAKSSAYPTTGWEPYGEPWEGAPGAPTKHTQFIRKLDTAELADKSMDIYKVWTAFRQEAGGPENPLFFLSDAHGLSQIPDEEIAILQFQPMAGSMGYQMSSLGGQAVQFVQEVE
jgi:hypothetical protein